MDIRYSVSELKEKYPQKIENFVDSVLDLKNEMPSKLDPPSDFVFPIPKNRYDDFVLMHLMAFTNFDPASPMFAHRSSTFLPWHRYFLRIFEQDLQSIKSKYENVTIPYWDWTNEKNNQDIWNEKLMGGNGQESDWRVMDGPFSYDSGNWKLYAVNELGPGYDSNDLLRQFGYAKINGSLSQRRLPNLDHVMSALKIDPYDKPNWDDTAGESFRNVVEGFYGAGRIHNIVHPWVGGIIIENGQVTYAGSMSVGASNNDPCFWLHHANIDRIWADWQLHEDHWNLDFKGYLPIVNGPAGINVNDPMGPWTGNNITPASVANFYSMDNSGYKYEKYYRENISDRNSSLELQKKFFSPFIFLPIEGDYNHHLKWQSVNTSTLERLKKPLFPLE
jgi:tyrosinase